MIDYKKIWSERPAPCQWCNGCGNFAVLKTISDALAELQIHPKDTLIVGGIGCAGQMPQYLPCNSLKMPHGRVLPTAIAANLAKPELTVLAQGGDGDAFAIGGGHFINAPGWNAKITYIVSNNEVYGLTKGQFSPTALPSLKTKAFPSGPLKYKMNPIAIALGAKWTFIARVMNVGKTKDGLDTGRQAIDVLKSAILHEGSSLIIFDTPCPTYNRLKTPQWLKERAVAIQTLVDYQHEPRNNTVIAYKVATTIFDIERIPVGIYYQGSRPTLAQKLEASQPLTEIKPNTEELKNILEEYK